MFRKFIVQCKNSSLVYYIKKLQRLSSEILGGLSYLKKMLLQIPMDSFHLVKSQQIFNLVSTLILVKIKSWHQPTWQQRWINVIRWSTLKSTLKQLWIWVDTKGNIGDNLQCWGNYDLHILRKKNQPHFNVEITLRNISRLYFHF